jgi:hypothetical protein
MTVLQVGDIAVQRIVEHEIPVYHPSEFFDEATTEAVEPYRKWLEPKALCPRTGRWIPTFPNTRYVFARDEYQAMESENSLIFIENVQPILEARQAVLVDLVASANTRKNFLNAHCESDSLALTAHFPSPSIGHIVPRGSGYDFNYV